MKYKGACHCNTVQFEVETDLAKVLRCNCSHCAMKGMLLVFVPAEKFSWVAGEGSLTEYRFNKKFIAHLFCQTCGVQPIGRAEDKDGKVTIVINVNCLEGIETEKLDPVPFNGKDL